jgi:ATP-dependent Clp protease ATP-binding subunit ClpA
MKVSFVLFDEIEKASDALWNLLLGILDKGTLTLGDNRRVDFSRALIFMTSNLGAAEMSNMLRPKLGFSTQTVEVCDALNAKVAKAGVEAARRKFTPEFMNRIDKVVVFQSLGPEEMERILTIELGHVRDRILDAGTGAFAFTLTAEARAWLLAEGTDIKYGARHLKRAIERSLVHQLSNLIASGQVQGGDVIRIDFDAETGALCFDKEAEGMAEATIAKLMDNTPALQSMAAAAFSRDLDRIRSANSPKPSKVTA